MSTFGAAVFMARRAEARAASTASTAQLPELDEDPEEQRDTVAMPAPGTPTAPPDDEEATSIFDREPPLYAGRHRTMRPPAPRPPLAHPDLIGCEDIADEPDHPYLAPDETTPPRRGRAALLVPCIKESDLTPIVAALRAAMVKRGRKPRTSA